jgi:hypothetical protein
MEKQATRNFARFAIGAGKSLGNQSVFPVSPIVGRLGRNNGIVVDLRIMAGDRSSSSNTESRVVNFRRDRAGVRTPTTAPPPLDDLAKYEQSDEADDYRHRMIVNIVAFVFVIGLIGAGLWLADTMARMRRNQDCVLSGRAGCTPVEVTKGRW